MIGSFAVSVVRVVFFTVLCLVLPVSSVQAESSQKYEHGDIYVELKDAKKLKRASPPFSHPHIIPQGKLRNILSSVSYREKGLLLKKGGKKVFNDAEIEALTPLIAEVLAKANEEEYLYVYVPRGRLLLSDLETTFIVFTKGKDLNIAFSRMQSRAKEVPRSNRKKRSLVKDPTTIESSGFWELMLMPGQTFEKGHRNWIVMNLQEKTFDAEPGASVAGGEGGREEYGFYERTNPVLEERLKKLEERIGVVSPDGSISAFKPSPKAKPSPKEEENLSEKFRDLKALLDEDLISPEEYAYKKKELLKRESKAGGALSHNG